MAERALSFIGIDELGDRPHVVVDGATRSSTVVTISHWPRSSTPRSLWRDLSVEMVFAAMRRRRSLWRNAVAATIDHLDEDGLAGLFAIVDPTRAFPLEQALVGLGRVGDFGVVYNRDEARTAFTVAAYIDRERSPLISSISKGRFMSECATELLGLLPEIITHPRRYTPLWAEEDADFAAGMAMFASGKARIDERTDLGLAIIDVDPDVDDREGPELGLGVRLPIHRASIATATSMPRVLVGTGHRYVYYDRYETWVRYVSRPLAKRRDLVPLAARLTTTERDGLIWRAESPGSLIPVLAHDWNFESSFGLGELAEQIIGYLSQSPMAWDPFAG